MPADRVPPVADARALLRRGRGLAELAGGIEAGHSHLRHNVESAFGVLREQMVRRLCRHRDYAEDERCRLCVA